MGTTTAKKTSTKGCLSIMIIASVIAFIMIKGCGDDTTSSPSSKSHEDAAYIVSKDFAKQKLTYPEEADFPWIPKYSQMDADSIYTVVGEVTSKNGFGVKVKFTYKCRLKFLGGDDLDTNNWQLIDMDMY